MTRILLFSISEDAGPFIHNFLNYGDDPRFYLVESQIHPEERSDFKTRLSEDESFDLASLTSVEECQVWADELWSKVKFVEPSIIAVADARTAQDGTIMMQWKQNSDPVEILPYGELSLGLAGSWWAFRVKHEQASDVGSDLIYVMDDIYGYYFGRRADFTEENGVFHPALIAEAICAKRRWSQSPA